jgi:L-ascorbate metabolism protein UlaG (beta-lactamase superfamily)
MKNLHYFIFWLLAIVSIFGFIRSDVTAAPDSLCFIGHASVKIKTSEGKIIYIDPFAGTASDYTDSADIVLITHQHSDHNNLSLTKRKTGCVVFTNAGAIVGGVYQSVTVGTVKIDGVAAYNTNHSKSTSVGFVLEFDGIKLYHAGDTGKISEMAELTTRSITYALLPVDGIYNMTPEAATEAAAMIQAQHDIPIHSMPPPDTYNESIVARFTSPNKLIVRNGETIELSSGGTSVGDVQNQPSSFSLGQNYPNPFNPTTNIEYTVPKSGFVSLKIFSAIGQEVASLVNFTQPAGTYNVGWHANDFSSGVYFYRIEAGEFTATKKLVLLR